MALTTGIKYPSNIASTVTLVNPTNATGAPNGAPATYTSTGTPSEFQITAWGYGFALPVGATIRGFMLYPTTSASTSLYNYTNLVNANTYTPCSVNTRTYVPATSLSTLTMGGATDLLGGASLNGTTFARNWSAADINDPYFGMQLNYGPNSPPSNFAADALGLEIFYDQTAPSGMLLRGVG